MSLPYPHLAPYLARYSEPEAQIKPFTQSYDDAVVIPALAETATLPDGLVTLDRAAAHAQRRVLAIIVVNAREDHPPSWREENEALLRLNLPLTAIDLHRVDRTSPGRTFPAKSGVGLARKIGCDLALAALHQGKLKNPWIRTTDGDARVPLTYFQPLSFAGLDRAAGALYPFHHPITDPLADQAVVLYEHFLRYYEAGVRWAGSPYAYRTIGSLIAFHANAYAAVRGFPDREAGEDFYFLNKLRKVGEIVSLDGDPIELVRRRAVRVPFGTTKSQVTIEAALERGEPYRLYHPSTFAELRSLLRASEGWLANPSRPEILPGLSAASQKAWQQLGGPEALVTIRRERRQVESARKHFSDWFDAFRTLKFIHAVEESYPKLEWAEALRQAPFTWSA